MTSDFCNFVNKATGEVVSLPKHYATLFPDMLECTDLDVECTDCVLPEPPAGEPEATEMPFSAPASFSISEPAKRSRRR